MFIILNQSILLYFPQDKNRRLFLAKLVNIYTDGACSGNQNESNVGGWGCVLEFMGKEKELCGGEVNTTNNRMELTALLMALSALKEEGLSLRIFSDSSYLINCFKSRWYVSWRDNGWKTSKKQPVENRDLWEQLLVLLEKNSCEYFLVKGHVKTPTQDNYKQFKKHNGEAFSFEEFSKIIEYNNRCDALANVFIKENQSVEI